MAVNTQVVAVFSKPMDKPATQAAFSLKRTSNGVAVCTMVWFGDALAFKSTSPLADLAQYTATISTAAKDSSGNNLAAAKVWKFTTASRPTVTVVVPSDGRTGVVATTQVLANFSKPMDKPATQAAFSLKRTSNGVAVSGTMDWAGDALVFEPASPFADLTQYTATISTAAKDSSGNNLAAAKIWKFTTASRPTVTSVLPLDGATGVAATTQVLANFSKPMYKPATENAFSLKRTSNGAPVAGSFSRGMATRWSSLPTLSRA